MNKRISVAVVALTMFFALNAKAQNVYDIITLKNGKGVIKGFINEQILGQSVSIIPTDATLQIDYDEVVGMPTKKSIETDSTTVEVDVIALKNGQTIEGKIIELAPNKWITIVTNKLSGQTYPLENIARIGKDIIDSKDDIFKEYGVLDVLTNKNGTIVKGIIIEQTFGETVKIKTIDKGILVYDIADIATVKKEAYDLSKDIFKQSAFLDVLFLKNGDKRKGIIINQVPGVEVKITEIGGSESSPKYEDVIKIIKELNPYKEEPAKPEIMINEPDSVGVCFYNDNNINRQINAYSFKLSRNGDLISLENAPLIAVDKFKNNTPISFIIKINGNVDDVTPTVKILKVAVNQGKQTKYIPIQKSKESILDILSDSQQNQTYKVEKYGKSSMKITFTPNEIGEYAVIFKGCQKITVFGVE